MRSPMLSRLVAPFLLLFAASAAAQWRSGATTYTDGFDIYTGYMQNATGYIVSQGYVANPPQPVVGQRFYVSVYMQAIASISRYMAVYFIPPAGTSIVNDPQMPVRCYYRARSGSGSFYEFTNTIVNDTTFPEAPLRIYGCPQPSTAFSILPIPGGSAYYFDRRDPQGANNAWPMPGQAAYEFLIPVVVDRAMNGISDIYRFYAPIQAIQGDGIDPWTYPYVALLVQQGTQTSSADMQATISLTSQTASMITVKARCSNAGPNSASNATCAVIGAPAGATTSCTPTSPQASLASGSFIECTLNFAPQAYTLTATTSTSTADPNPANNTATLSGTNTTPLIFANNFE